MRCVGPAVFANSVDMTNTFTTGSWHDINSQKSINSIGTTATQILTTTFANTAGTTAPLNKGARVNVTCLLAGSKGLSAKAYCYNGDFIISPGATTTTNCTLTLISESTSQTAVSTSLITISSSISGQGTNAILQLTTNNALTNQSVAIFYKVKGDNLVSVA